MFYKSLAIKMACAIVIVSVIPLIIMAALSRYFFVGSYGLKVLDHLTTVVRMQQREIDGFLAERLNAMRLMGLATPFETLSNETILQDRWSELRQVYGKSLLGLAFCDSQSGERLCVGSSGWKTGDYSGMDKLEQVSELGAYVWDVSHSTNGMQCFVLAVSVEQSEQKGVLLAVVGVEALTVVLEGLQQVQTGTAFILNSRGERLPSGPTKSLPARVECADTPVLDPLKNKDMTIRKTTDGAALCIRATVKNSDWMIEFVANMGEAYQAYSQPRIFAVATLLLGILGVVVVAVVVSNRFSRYVARVDQEKELINEKLVQAGKLAALGEMAANMGHEINNPVGIIVQEAQWIKALLQNGEASLADNMAEIEDSLDGIQSHGTRCRDIIFKLLTFARDDEPVVQPVQLNELIEAVLELCQRRAQMMNIELRLNLAPDLPMVSVTPSDAQQVLINLFNNGLDAMEQGGGTIDVRTSTRARYAVVEVEDTGPGISRKNLGRVFEPFFSTKPEGKGTGLGLSICYVMMKRMKGDITVTSEEGKGTVFCLFFPL